MEMGRRRNARRRASSSRIERFLPLAFIGGLTALSALSACVSPAIARSSKTHDSNAAAPSH